MATRNNALPIARKDGIDCQEALRTLRDYVRRNRLRYTAEREEIVRAVFGMEDHFNVAQIARRVRRGGRKISLTTVYRNMGHLVQAGLVSEVRCGRCTDEQIFEHVHRDRHHDHLTCVSCGRVVEFEDEAIEVLQKHVAEKYGFRLVRHHLDLVGVCSRCERADQIPRRAPAREGRR